MIDLDLGFMMALFTLLGILANPEAIKPVMSYVFMSLFAVALAVYWWLTSYIIKELWDTT